MILLGLSLTLDYDKVNRCGILRVTARAPKQPTNLPTGHQMSQQGLAQDDQKCHVLSFLGKKSKILLERAKVLVPT